MASIVDHLGPFIAIGKPGESVPDLGAHRLYIRDDRWREVLELLIREARLVILHTGGSGGIIWELQTVLALRDPRKLLIYFPPRPTHVFRRILDSVEHVCTILATASIRDIGGMTKQIRDVTYRNHEAFRSAANRLLRQNIPELDPQGGFVCFNADWGVRLHNDIEAAIEHIQTSN